MRLCDGGCRVQQRCAAGYSPWSLPPTVAVFIAVEHCGHRTRDRAACVSAAVHEGSPRQCACATVAAECSSDAPLDIAPGACRPLSLSSSPWSTAGTARGTGRLVSLQLYMKAVRGNALVRRVLPCR